MSPALAARLRGLGQATLGVLAGMGGLAVLIALVSYNSADPSLNTAGGSEPVRNLAGPIGAYLADLLLQGLGLAGLVPGLVLFGWAWRLLSLRGLSWPLARAAAMMAAPLALALAFEPAPAPPGWPGAEAGGHGLGGIAGSVLSVALFKPVQGWLGPFGVLFAWALALSVGIMLSAFAAGLTAPEWRSAGRAVAAGATRGGQELSRVGAGMGGRVLRATGAAGRGIGALLVRLRARLAERREARRAARAEAEANAAALSARASEPAAPAEGFDHRREPVLGAAPASSFAPMPVPPLRQDRDAMGEPPLDIPRPPLATAFAAPEAEAPHAAPEAEPPHALPPIEEMEAREGEGDAAPAQGRPRVSAPRSRQTAPRQTSLDLDHKGYRLPPIELLQAPSRVRAGTPTAEALEQNARLLESVLDEFGVKGQIVNIRPGPVVTLYELEPAPGTRATRVIGLADDIARSMSAVSVRIAAVPGRNVIGIELPNTRRETVFLSEMLAAEEMQRSQAKLALALGKDIGGAPIIADLARMPHLLIAGTTGSGKSVAINTMILSLVYRLAPEECRLVLIDPKMLELSVYDHIPHLLAPVVTEPAKAVGALKWTVREMERRYRAMSQLGVRNIAGYNQRVAEARAKGEILTRKVQTGFDPETSRPVYEEQPLALHALPYIVVVVDEMADLMITAGKEIEGAVQRLAQMARAAGIHVILATQRPSVDVITGVIKANFPTRISFQVTSKVDSRTILGEQGAEQLLGQGDMLYMAGGGRIMRVHGPFVSDKEVEEVVAHLRAQGVPDYVEEVTETEEEDEVAAGAEGEGGSGDELFDKAVALVAREGKASTSFIQRHLQIGYNRAARIIELMEKEGIVGPANHVGKREVLARRTDRDED
ncbi:MAG: DNA translocase FtsK 4TM domain-containing protein [Alphaproteobacteria bacterium]|nr:DNA translocase FtsK 4TM domain-containing protein [Alphaproteobacteria bacterium]